MFKFLKEKLKIAISKISEGVEKEGKSVEEIVERPVEEIKETEKAEQKGFFARLKERFAGKEEKETGEIEQEKIKEEFVEKKETASKIEIKRGEKPKIRDGKIIEKEGIKQHKPVEPKIAIKEEPKQIEEIPEKIEIHEPERKGFFETIKEKIITTKISHEQFDKLFWELELALMENNVAVEVVEKIKNDLKEQLVEKPIRRTKVGETIASTLKNSIEGLFGLSGIDLIKDIENKKDGPYIIAFFGINGSGKTTSIAKLANMLKDKKISCVFAASDTFRAASIEQLQQHADKLGIKLIKHDYGSDPAAVAFDAIKHAKAKSIDVVLIDTAGRMHSNQNLIDEMKKIIRVAKPDLKIFVGESITGNDCVEQAKTFNDAVGIDGIILAKADIDEKGGAAVSVSYVTKKPILFLGVGQNYGDLEEFNPEIVMKNLGFI